MTPTTAGFETSIVQPSAALQSVIGRKIARLRCDYEPYIKRIQVVARNVEDVIEEALASHRLTADDLFDVDYRRDGRCEPPQYMNRAVLPLEALVQHLVERELLIEPRPEFCFLQDRNGFAPVHNARYSKPPREDDRLWNLRHSRMRRIFDDRAGMAGSRNLMPFLVQSYARDMGSSIETLMEFDAPIVVQRRHWGVVRMAFPLAKCDAAPRQPTTTRRNQRPCLTRQFPDESVEPEV